MLDSDSNMIMTLSYVIHDINLGELMFCLGPLYFDFDLLVEINDYQSSPQIRIDGQDIQDVTLAGLWKSIGVVQQDTVS
ncbi:hypothetical protein SLEP1_g21046 [Rubroshorea leprosula]|uniref:Uncharacterized protein n=1 Tax=Rubroshorea leprosula TaxID=152421 RepID=A0AAV5J4M9_9ROSI|nr:hypothetical protein SLEP1_g21046 [Rubroshorea leprosula]